MKRIELILVMLTMVVSINLNAQNYWADNEIEFITLNNEDYVSDLQPDTEYTEGWKDGYYEGWKDIKGIVAPKPLIPDAPNPFMYRTYYKDGYNRGFKHGYMDARESEGW